MASIKKLSDRKFKITISNGYRPNGKKICKAKTITVPDSVKPRGIPQYVAHEAEELERLVKSGFAEDRDTTFETYAARWLERQVKYAPGTLASYRRMLERVYPYIGAIKLGELRPMALENLLIELRKAHPPGQAHPGSHRAEIPDRGVRRAQRRQAQRDHFQEPRPDD